ncbi:hypothetical protein [Alkaliphilus metalliredigens]|uniref:hypothetical protein n=1 Tax=Alkaliphilus metalliredigens TaxID=208226 RepID=UPI000300D249|nr:hypothetical protein [Alkaliphilus metalliredigens]
MKKKLSILFGVALLMLVLVACGSNEEEVNTAEDDGHEIPYEWSGVYTFEEDTYTLKFNKNEGDESCMIAFISKESGITDIEHHAIHIMEADMEDIAADSHFVAKDEYGYNLILNPDTSNFTIDMEKSGEYFLFVEHFPEEFDLQVLDSSGNELMAKDMVEYEGDHQH